MKTQLRVHDGQRACHVTSALKMKELVWLPFIDAIRTFLRSEPELTFKLPSFE
jgi:hypothetical protein